MNWYGGWTLVLVAFAVGAAVGLQFQRDEFWGGYTSWRRRMVRLGHIALAALGLFNVVYYYAPAWNALAGVLLLTGGGAMPAVCFLSAWKKPMRHLFFIPVCCLIGAVVIVLLTRRPA